MSIFFNLGSNWRIISGFVSVRHVYRATRKNNWFYFSLFVAEDIKKWWVWGYWSSPLMYAQNAISVNEFFGKSWNHVRILLLKRFLYHLCVGKSSLFSAMQVPENESKPLGLLVLESRGIFTKSNWYWIGAGAMVGYIFLFNTLFSLALEYLNRKHRQI